MHPPRFVYEAVAVVSWSMREPGEDAMPNTLIQRDPLSLCSCGQQKERLCEDVPTGTAIRTVAIRRRRGAYRGRMPRYDIIDRAEAQSISFVENDLENELEAAAWKRAQKMGL